MTKNIRRIYPTEHHIQAAIVELANTINSPFIYLNKKGKFGEERRKLSDFLIKQANEGKRSWITGKKMKKEGLKKGVSDLFLAIPVSRKNLCGLWMEVKSKKGKVSDSQQRWGNLMKMIGYWFVDIYTVDEGIQAIKDYLGMR